MSRFGLVQILKASGKITTQDLGRKGWSHLGICESGAADEMAYLWANHLVGNTLKNPEACAALEITLGQVALAFTAPTLAAITGANVEAFLNDKPLPNWQSFRVGAGDVLRLSLPKAGLINYLAVQGGFNVRRVCGSASVCERESIGPFNGRALQVTQCIGYRESQSSIPLRLVRKDYIPRHNGQDIPFIPRADASFKRDSMLAQIFTVSPATNRMGCRLTGNPITMAGKQTDQCISAGMPYGAVQLPPDGQPIVLLKDRQTMGGYPLLGCLSRLGGGRLAQCRPGEAVNFTVISREQALRQLRERYVFFGA